MTTLNFGTGTGTLFGSTPATTASTTFGSIGGGAGVGGGLAIGGAPTTPFTIPMPTTSTAQQQLQTSTTPQLTFGQRPATTTTAAPVGNTFSLSSTPQTQIPSLSFGVQPQTAVSQQPTSTPVLTSFGTLQNLSSKPSDLNASQSKPVSPKDQQIPLELIQLVDQLKKHIDEQKKCQLELSRASVSRQALKVSDDAELLKRELLKIESVLTKNKAMDQKLKDETIKMVGDCETLQRMVEIPRGSSPDLSTAREYFTDLITRFDNQVVSLRNELDNAQRHVNSQIRATSFTPQDLSLSMQRLYECFVALAGRYQSIHSNVATLKARHLEMRRQQLNDFTDIFQRKKNIKNKSHEMIVPEKGPTPFVGHRNYHTISMIASRSKQASTLLPQMQQHQAITAGLTGMPTNFLLPAPAPMPASLALSPQSSFSPRPTHGSKRGKR